VNFQSNRGWFINGSAAHTWRGDITLDRPYYYTEDKLFLTDQVDMPGIFTTSSALVTSSTASTATFRSRSSGRREVEISGARMLRSPPTN
jgi:hypothetical protein